MAQNKVTSRFHCPCCKYVGTSAYQMIVHKRVHTGERPFACTAPGCKKAFSTTSNRNQHVKNVHRSVRVKCSICEKQFSSQTSCNNHKAKKHIKNPFFKCTVCNDRFFTIRDRNQHTKRKHTGFKCRFCIRSFKTTSLLIDHKREEHADVCAGGTNRFPYSCAHCELAFLKEHELAAHQQSCPRRDENVLPRETENMPNLEPLKTLITPEKLVAKTPTSDDMNGESQDDAHCCAMDIDETHSVGRNNATCTSATLEMHSTCSSSDCAQANCNKHAKLCIKLKHVPKRESHEGFGLVPANIDNIDDASRPTLERTHAKIADLERDISSLLRQRNEFGLHVSTTMANSYTRYSGPNDMGGLFRWIEKLMTTKEKLRHQNQEISRHIKSLIQ